MHGTGLFEWPCRCKHSRTASFAKRFRDARSQLRAGNVAIGYALLLPDSSDLKPGIASTTRAGLALTTCTTWPAEVYLRADPALRQDIYRFLIANRRAHFIAGLAHAHGWLVTWYLELFALCPPTAKQARDVAKEITEWSLTGDSRRLFRDLRSRFPQSGIVLAAWITHLSRSGHHSEVIATASEALGARPRRPRRATLDDGYGSCAPRSGR